MKMTAREQRMMDAMNRRRGMMKEDDEMMAKKREMMAKREMMMDDDEMMAKREMMKDDELEDDAEMRARMLKEAAKKRIKGGGKFSMRPPMEMEG